MKPLANALLYGIVDTGYVAGSGLAEMTWSLLRGGADLIQLRAKKETPEEFLSIAKELAPICRHAGIPFILIDHPELVQEAGANGAHVGQEDFSVADARKMAGPGALIGKSTHSVEQAVAAASESPDYIGFGPLFATPTKPDYTPIGTEQIRTIHSLLTLPIFCIGGVKLSNLASILNAGALRVVIVSDLLKSQDPAAQTAACKLLLRS